MPRGRPKGRVMDPRKALVYNWDDMPVLVDVAIVCRVLGICSLTAQRMCADGTLPAFKVGRCWRIRREDLKQFAGVA